MPNQLETSKQKRQNKNNFTIDCLLQKNDNDDNALENRFIDSRFESNKHGQVGKSQRRRSTFSALQVWKEMILMV